MATKKTARVVAGDLPKLPEAGAPRAMWAQALAEQSKWHTAARIAARQGLVLAKFGMDVEGQYAGPGMTSERLRPILDRHGLGEFDRRAEAQTEAVREAALPESGLAGEVVETWFTDEGIAAQAAARDAALRSWRDGVRADVVKMLQNDLLRLEQAQEIAASIGAEPVRMLRTVRLSAVVRFTTEEALTPRSQGELQLKAVAKLRELVGGEPVEGAADHAEARVVERNAG